MSFGRIRSKTAIQVQLPLMEHAQVAYDRRATWQRQKLTQKLRSQAHAVASKQQHTPRGPKTSIEFSRQIPLFA